MRTKIGPYRIVDSIGGGAQGRVFRAVHSGSGREVALKAIPVFDKGEEADRARKRVLREIEHIMPVRHSSIVRIYDAGEHFQRTFTEEVFLYIAYELVHGVTLRQRLLSVPALLPVEVSQLAVRLGSALGALHRRSVLHRDIKPENIVLRGGTGNSPVLIDFGYLAATHPGASLSSVAHGSLGYMAPETLTRADAASQWSDQWSLARTLADALLAATGLPAGAFLHEPASAIVAALGQAAPATSAALQRALSHSPNERYPHVEHMVSALCGGLREDSLITVTEESTSFSQLLDMNAVVPLAQTLSRFAGISIYPYSFTDPEILLLPSGRRFWGSVQLVLWRLEIGSWSAGLMFRSREALDLLINSADDEATHEPWSLLANRLEHLSVGPFNASSRSEQFEFYEDPGLVDLGKALSTASGGVLAESAGEELTHLLAYLCVSNLTVNGGGLVVALKDTLAPTQLLSLVAGDPAPLEPLLELWRSWLARYDPSANVGHQPGLRPHDLPLETILEAIVEGKTSS
jgi:serine/threonine protein kinase